MNQMHIFPFPEYGNARRHPKAHLQAGLVHTAAAAYSKLSIYIAHKKAPFQWGKREREKDIPRNRFLQKTRTRTHIASDDYRLDSSTFYEHVHVANSFSFDRFEVSMRFFRYSFVSF